MSVLLIRDDKIGGCDSTYSMMDIRKIDNVQISSTEMSSSSSVSIDAASVSKFSTDTVIKGVILTCTVVITAVFIATVITFASAFYVLYNLDSDVEQILLTLRDNDDLMKNFTTSIVNIQFVRNTINEKLDEMNDRLSSETLILSTNMSKLRDTFSVDLSTIENITYAISDQLNSSENTIANLLKDNLGTQDKNRLFVDLSIKAGHAFSSCATILQLSPSSQSGFYYIRSSSGSAFTAFCDMTLSCGGMNGGWMRVASLNMKLRGQYTNQCPKGFDVFLRISKPYRTCRRMTKFSCSSEKFEVPAFKYSNVCGRIIAYQYRQSHGVQSHLSIDENYVDGVSLTHGRSPRQHIWTFVNAFGEGDAFPRFKCPCINTAIQNMTPPFQQFIGNDYFCDTGAITGLENTFYGDDPLWDGAGCGPNNTCCSFNNPPWFYKSLPKPTTDDIEMRLCHHDTSAIGTTIEIIEGYVR